MKELIKKFITIFMVLYIFCPVDLHPGPLDDIIFAVLGILVQNMIGNGNEESA